MLVDALTGPRRSAPALRAALARGERLSLSTLVLYEWLRGPRQESELAHQQGLFPAAQAVPFGAREAIVAADLYRGLPGARRREFDLAVAACALANGAALWTLNAADFRDVPSLNLFETPPPG